MARFPAAGSVAKAGPAPWVPDRASTDRPLRLLFPKGMRNDVQSSSHALRRPRERPDILAITASAALTISKYPGSRPDIRHSHRLPQRASSQNPPTPTQRQRARLSWWPAARDAHRRSRGWRLEVSGGHDPRGTAASAGSQRSGHHPAGRDAAASGQASGEYTPATVPAEVSTVVIEFMNSRDWGILAAAMPRTSAPSLAKRGLSPKTIAALGEKYDPKRQGSARRHMAKLVRPHPQRGGKRPDGRAATDEIRLITGDYPPHHRPSPTHLVNQR